MATNDVAWVDVLPSMRQFMPTLDRAIQAGMPTAGRQAGESFGQGFQQKAADSVDKVSQLLTAARNKEADAAGKLRVAEEKLNELRAKGNASASTLAAAEERLSAAQRTLADRMESTESVARRLSDAQEQAKNKTQGFSDSLAQVERNAGTAERGMGKVTSAVGGLVAGMGAGAAVVGAFWSNMSNEAGNDRLAASLGLNATRAAEAGQITARIYQGAWGESMEEVSGAVGAVMSSVKGMSDASVADIERVSIKALEFAQVFEVDMATAVQTVGNMVANGLAPTADAAFDLLVAGAQKVPVAVREDLLAAVDEYGTFFTGLGFTGEQTMSALVAASSKGAIGIDKMGDAIKEFSIRSTDMSTTSVAAYDTLGLSAEDMTRRILAGGDSANQATGEIIDGLLGIEDPAVRANTAIALFGTPLEDLNVTEIPQFLEGMRGMGGELGTVEGAADRMSATLNDNFATKVEGWKRQAMSFAQDGLMSIYYGFIDGARSSDGWRGALETVGVILGDVWGVLQGVTGFLGEHIGIVYGVAGALAAWYIAQGIATAATIAGSAASFIATASTYGLSYALTAGGTAARIYAAGQWIANASLLGFPLVWVLAAFAAVVAGLVLLWQHSETFRNIVTAVWDAVQAGISFAWNSVIMPVFRWFGDAWTFLGGVIRDGWTGIIQPAWRAVQDAASFMWNSVLMPTFRFIGDAWGAMVAGIKWAWDNVLKPAWDFIAAAAHLLYQILAVIIFAPILVAWELMTAGMRWAWENVLQPTWRAIETAANWLWRNVLEPVWNAMKAAWDALLTAFRWAWDNILSPTWRAIEAAARFLWENVARPIWSAMEAAWRVLADAIRWVYANVIQPAFDAVSRAVNVVKDAFQTAVDWIGRIWNGLKSLLATPINFMIGTVWNNGIRKAWNLVADLLPGVDPIGELATIPTNAAGGQIQSSYAHGGKVRGQWRGPTADNILAMVDNKTPIRVNPREWIHPVGAVEMYGERFMRDVQLGRFPVEVARNFYQGGLASFATGGQLFSEIRREFPKAKSNSQFRPGDPGYHGRNMAVDLGEEGFAGGAGRPYLAAMKRWLVDNYGRSSEIIYNGIGNDRTNIKNGSALAYSAAVQAQHRNHVHWAHGADLASARSSGMAGIGNMILGGVDSAMDVVQGLLDKVVELFTGPARAVVNRIPFDAPPKFLGIPKAWGNTVIDKAADFFNADARSSAETNMTGDAAPMTAASGSVVDQVKAVFASKGWNVGPQWNATDWIVQHESGWKPNAQNPVSTASGLFQHIDATWRAYRPSQASGFAKMRLAPVNYQGIAGMNYIASRYGTPTAARAYWERNNHYAQGGQIPTLFDTGGIWDDGVLGLNLTGGQERVMAPDQDDYFRRFVDATTAHDGGGGDRMLAKEIKVYANDRDQGAEIVDRLWTKVRVADRGGVWSHEED